MRNKRQWGIPKCKAEWDKLVAAGAKRDHGGPPDALLRFQMPSWMTGEDVEEGRDIHYEDKRLDRQSKLARMTFEVQESIAAETRKGFLSRELLATPGSSSSLSAPLTAGAVTSGDARPGDALGLLTEFAQDAAMGSATGQVGDARHHRRWPVPPTR